MLMLAAFQLEPGWPKSHRTCCVQCKMKCSHLKSTQRLLWTRNATDDLESRAWPGWPGHGTTCSSNLLVVNVYRHVRVCTMCATVPRIYNAIVPWRPRTSLSHHASDDSVSDSTSVYIHHDFSKSSATWKSLCQWGVHIYYWYAKYGPCTILHIDFGVQVCILFCILLHIYVKNLNMQNIQNLKICKKNSAGFIFIWNP